MELLFNDGWEFTKQAIGCNIHEIEKAENTWNRVDIPHDWVIYNTAYFHESCEGWYRKHFDLSLENDEGEGTIKSPNRYLLRFDGIYMDSSIYVNGIKVGEWKYGYSTFELDITDALQDGENEILVQVVLQVPNSRWYTGGGIYRNVWLRLVPEVYLASDGIYITTYKSETDKNSTTRNIKKTSASSEGGNKSHEEADDSSICFKEKQSHEGSPEESENSSWTVRIESDLVSSTLPVNLTPEDTIVTLTKKDKENRLNIQAATNNTKDIYTLRHIILDEVGTIVASSQGDQLTQQLSITSPTLWDLEEPYLYTLRTELLRNGESIDERINRFGFRSINFDPNQGFFLNGRQVKLHGACQHHDLGALGAAVNRAAIKRQLKLLQEMGVNAIRTAHNMCAVELLELCDEMGLLVNSEAFDMWEKPKNQYDYARFFKEWAERDVANWVRRDRNHPCVIMWSIGNEIYDTHADEHGLELTKWLMDLVYRHDPYKNAWVTIGSNYMPWENTQKCADIVKLAGYNYGEKYYEAHHAKYKDWMIYGSETGSVVQSRGIYHFPLSTEILSDDDEQCSSLGNSITSWGARSIEKCIIDDRDASFSAGMFIWSGFDYIGEPTPYHTKNSYLGQIDTAGFPKDAYYVYQAAWTDYRKSPMVHLFPYWDFNDGQLIDVRVCSNAPKVELFFNGTSQGSFEIDHKKGRKLIGDWQLPYQRGELRALAYDENNHIIAEDIQRSFSDATQIILRPDKRSLVSDGRDLIFVEISMVDEEGNPVPNANNRVDVKVTGAGRLIGLDNGDSTDYESYKGSSRRLFSGKLLAIIAAKTFSGAILMEVSSVGIPDAQISLEAEECEVPAGVSATEENTDNSGNSELPIRKLELISSQSNKFHEGLRELEVEASVYPQAASYQDISWRVTNQSGVDSNIVRLIPDGNKAILEALGDGTFYLRATTNNGGKKPRLISALNFTITGLGTAYLNPYGFISGSSYAKSIGEISSGNERGAATSRDGESILIYDKLDFGEIGSDEITLPIFELGSQPTRIEIWEREPGTPSSTLLADVIYHKKTIWNTYQEETYSLVKRLKGISSIAFLLRSKVHIKGFSFKQPEKAYEQQSVLNYSTLYGDNYEIKENYIQGIGNNVTLTFTDMDFSTRGLKKLIICGRTDLDKNTIHVRFKGDTGEVTQLAEFPYTPEFIEREFAMESITGQQTVTFLFLPGSNFDFKWFRFE